MSSENINSEILIPAISLWQPWANLVVTKNPLAPNGTALKQYETRHWTTKKRGVILIHAAQKWKAINKYLMDDWPFSEFKKAVFPLAWGSIIGCVRLEGVITTEKWLEENTTGYAHYEKAFGDYGPKRFAWKLSNPVRFETPVPYKGLQGFFNVPLSAIDEQYHSILLS